MGKGEACATDPGRSPSGGHSRSQVKDHTSEKIRAHRGNIDRDGGDLLAGRILRYCLKSLPLKQKQPRSKEPAKKNKKKLENPMHRQNGVKEGCDPRAKNQPKGRGGLNKPRERDSKTDHSDRYTERKTGNKSRQPPKVD